MLTRDCGNSLQSDHVEDIGEIDNFLMIEAELTKQNVQLEDDYVYLLKNGKDIMQDIPSDSYVDDYNEKDEILDIVDKRKY